MRKILSIGFVVLSVFLLSTLNSSAQTETYAEKLGWPQGTKVVIFHIDDAGRSDDINNGVKIAYEEGVDISTSIMIPRERAEEFCGYVKQNPKIDAGLHIDIDMGTQADQIEDEIKAQIDQAIQWGITPTHMDAEGAFQLNEQNAEAFVNVAVEKKLPLLFYGNIESAAGSPGFNKNLFQTLSLRLWDAKLPLVDYIIAHRSHPDNYDERKAELIQVLKEMKPGINQIIFHCSKSLTGEPLDANSKDSEDDLQLLLDPDIKALIEKEGIVVSSWRELMQKRQTVSA